MVLLLIKNMLDAQESHPAVTDSGLEDQSIKTDARSYSIKRVVQKYTFM